MNKIIFVLVLLSSHQMLKVGAYEQQTVCMNRAKELATPYVRAACVPVAFTFGPDYHNELCGKTAQK